MPDQVGPGKTAKCGLVVCFARDHYMAIMNGHDRSDDQAESGGRAIRRRAGHGAEAQSWQLYTSTSEKVTLPSFT
jgi:hypothetical protein